MSRALFLSSLLVFCGVGAGCSGGSRIMAQADRAFLDGRHEEAISLYESLVGNVSDERSGEALLRIAEIESGYMGRSSEAEKVLRELTARFPKTRAGYRGQLRLVELYRNDLQDPVLLVPAVLRAMEMRRADEHEDLLRLALAEGYLGRGDYAQARIELEELVTRRPDSQMVPEARLMDAYSYELQGSVTDALERYREVERRFAGTRTAVEAMLGRARMLEVMDRLEEAERLYVECLGYGGNRPATAARLTALRERRERRLSGAPAGVPIGN